MVTQFSLSLPIALIAASRIGLGSTKPGGSCCVAAWPPANANRPATHTANAILRDINPPIRNREILPRRRCRRRGERLPRARRRALHHAFFRVIADALREPRPALCKLRVGDGAFVVGLVDRLQLALEDVRVRRSTRDDA